MENIIKTLELLFSVFSFLTGYRLTRGGKASVKQTVFMCAAVLGVYWTIFLPVLLIKRRLGLSDIGRVTILREAFFFGSSTVPFAGYAGGLVLSLLLMLLLTRIPKMHPLFSAWLMVVMPVTAAEAVAFYALLQPMLVTALKNLQLAICCVGVGCVMAQWPIHRRIISAPVRMLFSVLALAGHFLLPQVTVGALQLVGNRVSFTFDLDALYLPVIFCALRGEAPAFDVHQNKRAEKPYFTRETTASIKGICIVTMFAHHFFTFPDWYVDGISYPELAGFAELCQLPLSACVPVFAFITGYFYAFSRKKNLNNSFAKIAGVLGIYWLIQALLYALAAASGAQLRVDTFLWELIGLENAVVTFNWYIAFYIMAMLMLPVLTQFPQRNAFAMSLVFIGLPIVGATAVRALAPYDSHASTAAQYMLDGIAGLGVGYIVAQYGFFDSADRLVGSKSSIKLMVCTLLGIMAFFGRRFAPRLVIPVQGLSESWALRISMDVLYAPVLIYALANLLPALPGICMRILGEMGKYSLHMWLLSCVFFNVSKETYQRLLYLPEHPVLVLLWGLLLCYGAARGVDALQRVLMMQSGRKKFSRNPLQIRKNRV